MKDLSNWGRWGQDDQMGAVNLITPAKRKQARRWLKRVPLSRSRVTPKKKSPSTTRVPSAM